MDYRLTKTLGEFMASDPRPPTHAALDRPGLRLFVVSLGALLAMALYFVFHGQLNADEGFYLLASRVVRQGLRPYQDFGFTQGPILPYVDVPWLELFGYTLDGQRLACLVWTLLMIGCGAFWLRRTHSWAAAVLFIIILAGAPMWVAFTVKGKTYAFGSLCVLLGVLAMLSQGRLWLRWLVFVAAAGLGIGARYPLAGFFVPAGIGLLMLTPGWKARLAGLGFVLACATVELSIFAAGHWENFLFWTAQFHREALFHFPVSRRVMGCLTYAPGVWLVAIWAFVTLVRLKHRPALLALGSLLFAVVLNVSAPSTYAEYVLPFVPAAVLVAVPVVVERLITWRRVQVILTAVAFLAIGWISPPELSRDILLHAGEAEAFLRDRVPPDSIVIGSMPEIAVAAGMHVPLTILMGKFAVTEDYSLAVATKRKMLTPDLLRDMIRDVQTRAVVLSAFASWNFSWSVPSYKAVSLASQNGMRAAINEDYQLAFVNNDYLIFLRKGASAPAKAPASPSL